MRGGSAPAGPPLTHGARRQLRQRPPGRPARLGEPSSVGPATRLTPAGGAVRREAERGQAGRCRTPATRRAPERGSGPLRPRPEARCPDSRTRPHPRPGSEPCRGPRPGGPVPSGPWPYGPPAGDGADREAPLPETSPRGPVRAAARPHRLTLDASTVEAPRTVEVRRATGPGTSRAARPECSAPSRIPSHPAGTGVRGREGGVVVGWAGRVGGGDA